MDRVDEERKSNWVKVAQLDQLEMCTAHDSTPFHKERITSARRPKKRTHGIPIQANSGLDEARGVGHTTFPFARFLPQAWNRPT